VTRVGWIRLAVIVAFVAALEAMCRTGIVSRMTMIPPSEMAVVLWGLLSSGRINEHLERTLGNVALAFVLSVVVGFVVGVMLHAMPRLRRAVDPLLASYYAVPFFVFYPVFIVIFGMGNMPLVMIGFLFAVVAMIINTMNGLDRIPRVLFKVARVHRMNPFSEALLIKLPSAAPHLFTGVKLAVAYSFIGVIAAEFILSTSGLGYSIAYAYNNFDNRTMYALMLFILVLVTAINMALYLWEQRILRRRRGR
jgi:NitT/TauT family transport system permease protein